jgi:hypothetical protein
LFISGFRARPGRAQTGEFRPENDDRERGAWWRDVVSELLSDTVEESMSPMPSLLNRVRSEFIEMPGLRLRIEQAQRLWNLDRQVCEHVLQSLVETNFLRQYGDDGYSRV